MRGVVIVPEVRMPGHTYSWRHADKALVAECPTLSLQNPHNAVLNPLYEKTLPYALGAVKETI